MKKFGLGFVALLLALALTACSSGDKPAEDGKADIVLITDVGTIDDKSFNQGSWEGVELYAKENKISHTYLRPASANDNEYYNTIAKAINEMEAKVIVTPGFLFNNAIWRAQADFPDVHFIFVDSEPQENMEAAPLVGENTVALLYEEQQAGYLAGYAAVKEGMTKLGFVGGIPVPAVKKFGLGYLQGASDAAVELGVDVEVRWNYTMGFEPTPEVQQLAAGWYIDGTEVIFASAGGAGNSVFKAAEDANAKAIGVDSDQSAVSTTVIGSAIKQLQTSVADALKAHYDGTFPGGKSLVYGIDKDSVGLMTDFTRFEKFTKEEYDTIYEALKTNKDGIRERIATDHEGDYPTVELPRVTLIKN